MIWNVLLIGDIVGRPGRQAVATVIPRLRAAVDIHWIIANAENAAGGSGVTPAIADELYRYGVNVLTSGNHIWGKKEIVPHLDADSRLLRPINYPEDTPGKGAMLYTGPSGVKIGVVNVMGRVFMDVCECPFRSVQAAVEALRQDTPVIFVDVHAEATSEKIAMSWYLDGKVSCVFGTHTHVQTADERVLPRGTARITDVGMTGPHDSVIGRRTDQIIQKFLTHRPMKFEMATENPQLHGAIVEVNTDTGQARSIRRVSEQVAT